MMMLSDTQRDLVRDRGTVLARVLMGLLFIVTGLNMLIFNGPTNTASYFESLGIPLASLVVWVVILIKLAAGTAIIVGKRVGLASAVLIVFVLLATMIAHRSFDDVNLFKNLAIVGGLLYLMAYGPGGSFVGRFAPTEDDKDGNGMPDSMQ